MADSFTFPKKEKLKSEKLIGNLFNKGKSLYKFPIKALYQIGDDPERPIAVAVSVPKKRFRKAVQRNRLKRLIREAYRHQKSELLRQLSNKKRSLRIMLIFVAHEEVPQKTIEKSLVNIFSKINAESNS